MVQYDRGVASAKVGTPCLKHWQACPVFTLSSACPILDSPDYTGKLLKPHLISFDSSATNKASAYIVPRIDVSSV